MLKIQLIFGSLLTFLANMWIKEIIAGPNGQHSAAETCSKHAQNRWQLFKS